MSKKNTALMEAINRIRTLSKVIPVNTKENRAIKGTYVHSITIIQEYLESNNKEIMDAFFCGKVEHIIALMDKKEPMDSKEYFNNTYNK